MPPREWQDDREDWRDDGGDVGTAGEEPPLWPHLRSRQVSRQRRRYANPRPAKDHGVEPPSPSEPSSRRGEKARPPPTHDGARRSSPTVRVGGLRFGAHGLSGAVSTALLVLCFIVRRADHHPILLPRGSSPLPSLRARLQLSPRTVYSIRYQHRREYRISSFRPTRRPSAVPRPSWDTSDLGWFTGGGGSDRISGGGSVGTRRC